MSERKRKEQHLDSAGSRDETALLISAVEDLLASTLVPALKGYEQYHARVARNTLAIVRRQLAAKEIFQSLDEAYLPRFGVSAGSDLAALSARIESHEVEMNTELLDYLKRRTLLQLEIDNPGYWGCEMAREQWCESLKRTAELDLK